MNFAYDNDDEHQPIRKQKQILLAFVVMVVSTPFEFMVMKYIDINYGERNGTWHFCYNIVLFLILVVINFEALNQPPHIKNRKKLDSVLSLIVAVVIIVCKIYFVHYRMNAFEEQTLSNSNYTIGIITQKHLVPSKYGPPTYYIWVGQNDSLTRLHKVSEHLYTLININDSVLLQVSKEYPRINKVLNWTPTNNEIEELVEVK